MNPMQDLARRSFAAMPRTGKAMEHLVMSLADLKNNWGKRSIFGADKGVKAQENFYLNLSNTMRMMMADGLVESDATSKQILEKLQSTMMAFEVAYPNWQDAYGLWRHFANDAPSAISVLTQLRPKT